MKVLWALLVTLMPLSAAGTVNFSREILPLLSDKCFSCHGADPSTRMAGLRLDLREEATKPRRGKAAVTPGKPEESLILARIAPANPASIMPPERSHKAPLSPEQVETFRRWIEQGAVSRPRSARRLPGWSISFGNMWSRCQSNSNDLRSNIASSRIGQIA